METLSRRIEALPAARSVPELAAEVQTILWGMMYYLRQSEGALLDCVEDWHAGSTAALRDEYHQAGPPAPPRKPPKPPKAERPPKADRRPKAVRPPKAERRPSGGHRARRAE